MNECYIHGPPPLTLFQFLYNTSLWYRVMYNYTTLQHLYGCYISIFLILIKISVLIQFTGTFTQERNISSWLYLHFPELYANVALWRASHSSPQYVTLDLWFIIAVKFNLTQIMYNFSEKREHPKLSWFVKVLCKVEVNAVSFFPSFKMLERLPFFFFLFQAIFSQ